MFKTFIPRRGLAASLGKTAQHEKPIALALTLF